MNRRELLKLGSGALLASTASANALTRKKSDDGSTVEQWGVFEARFPGPTAGNPFVDVQFGACFSLGHRTLAVEGFYDGAGFYKVRFSPDAPGNWRFETTANRPELAGKTGGFHCTAATAGNHGPVGVAHQFHFAHADGTAYFPFGTTCYAYGFIDEPVAKLTVAEMKRSGFNKMRFCLLPKPIAGRSFARMPFATAPGASADESQLAHYDLTRPSPEYFAQIEERIAELGAIGVEADLILFHPYDPQRFSAMDAEANDRFLRYTVARLACYRNLWWSIANEFDLVKTKSLNDWDRFFRIVQESDPYARLRSIHHSKTVYDHAKPWCTHASLQEYDFEKSEQRRQAWRKPILYDEIQYEGNIERRWGNLPPEVIARRFWQAIVNGAYATHGETYRSPDALPMWTDAGKLRGTSPARIDFLRRLLETTGTSGLTAAVDPYYTNAFVADRLYLWYFGDHSPAEYAFPLPEKISFRATLLDPWAMTRTPLEGRFSGKSTIALPGKPYQAILFERA